MFSNGSDYDAFFETNCFKCPLYVHYDNTTTEKPVCEIEERIALGCCGDESAFPYEWLDRNNTMPTYSCRKRLGKKKEFKTVDQLPQKPKPLDKSKYEEMFKDLCLKGDER